LLAKQRKVTVIQASAKWSGLFLGRARRVNGPRRIEFKTVLIAVGSGRRFARI